MMRITPWARSGRPSGPANQRPVSSTQVLLCASGPSTRQYSTWYGTPVPKSRCADRGEDLGDLGGRDVGHVPARRAGSIRVRALLENRRVVAGHDWPLSGE